MGNSFANIFGASPVQPLEKHVDIAYRCAKQLSPLFCAAARGIEAIDLRVVGRILISRVVTIPAGACLAVVFFFMFKSLLP